MDKRCGVLFSGGLDSSLTVCKMIEAGYHVNLIHFNQGTLISNDLPGIRYEELKRVYQDRIGEMHYENVSGLFRRFALVSLEDDVKKYGSNLVCVGCKLAMHIQCILFCKRNGISTMADGSTERQKRYGEQREIAIKFFTDLYKDYGISYINPVYLMKKEEIKYGLFDRGMTIQPLEDTCLFSHTFTTPSDEAIEQYLTERKILCTEIIERSLSYEKN